MRHNKMILWLGMLALLVGAAACAEAQPAPAPTLSEITMTQTAPPITAKTPEPGRTRLPTRTPTRTYTPTPIYSGYAGLADGEYILYVGDNILAVSIDGGFEKEIFGYPGLMDIATISEDKKSIIVNAFDPFMVNLETMTRTELPFLQGCLRTYLLKDNQGFFTTCPSPSNYFEVFYVSIDGGQKEQLTTCSNLEGLCIIAGYAPDGKWLAYTHHCDGACSTPDEGLYILSTDCLASAKGCFGSAWGPYDDSWTISWLLEGKFIYLDQEQAYLYHFDGSKLTYLREFDEIDPAYDLSNIIWSPDNTKIVLVNKTNPEQAGIFDAATGKLLLDGIKLTWASYPLTWVKIVNGKVTP